MGTQKGCEKMWYLLCFVLDLLMLKAKYGWFDSSFKNLFLLLSGVLLKRNYVSTSIYLAKKVISPLTMGMERIHACPNHCIMFHGV